MNSDTISVITIEDPSAEYGSYSWSSGSVLAEHVWACREDLAGKRVLELGAGTAAPGVVAARCGADVVLTDQASSCLLERLRQTCRLNGLGLEEEGEGGGGGRAEVRPLTWGTLSPAWLQSQPFDLLLASDCLYHSTDFEDFLVTVSFLLEQREGSKLWLAYQERSSHSSLGYLFKRWGLEAKGLPLPTTHDVIFPSLPPAKLSPPHNILIWEVRKK